MMRKHGYWMLITALVTAVAFTFAVPVYADADYRQRQRQALSALANEFTPRDYRPTKADGTEFGKDTARLLAKLEAGERGFPNGLHPASPEAEAHVRRLAQTAVEYLGTPGEPGRWSWENTGSPTIMYAAMIFGVILNKWSKHLEPGTRELLARALTESVWKDDSHMLLVNGRFNINVGELLGGEALGYDSELWQRGVKHFEATYNTFMTRTAHELNSPTYTSFQLSGLLILQNLEHEEIRTKARIMLDTFLTAHGHLYQSVGSPGAPRSRDYGGGAKIGTGGMRNMYWLLFGLSEKAELTSYQMVAAITDYAPPAIIRSFFTDKGDGYTFWLYNAETVAHRMPGTGYDLGPERTTVAPWHVVMMPDGEVAMGFSYGHRYQAIHVSMGVIAREVDGRFHALYQYQPWIHGDRTTSGAELPTTSDDKNPDDFTREGYQYERMLYGRTMLSLWNPTTSTYKDTRVHLPRWDQHGGQMIEGDGWFAGRMGDTYIAYRPVGTIVERDNRSDGTDYIYLRMETGPSGGIYELAEADQFDSLEHYLDDLRSRHFAFDPDVLAVEFDAIDPETRELVRVKLQYETEQRWIDGQPITMDAIDRGLMDSPWVDWDPETRRLVLSREGYPTIVYDVLNNSVSMSAPETAAGD